MKESNKPITGSQALQWAVPVLLKHGLEPQTARLESRLLLGKAWNKKGIDLVTALRDTLEKETWNKYRDLVELRTQGEPLQYLLGEQEFMGLSLKLSPQVFIPRGDSEVLVNQALQAAKEFTAPRILDLGTGSGAIAVSLAYYLPASLVWAVDISREAIEVARDNAKRVKVEARINFICGDLFAPLTKEAGFDLIVSNPPYISATEYISLPPEVKKEPYRALYGGQDGMDYYRAIGASAGQYLAEGGRLFLEIGWEQGDPVSRILRENSFEEIKIIKDGSGYDRVVTGRHFTPVSPKR